MVNLNFYYEDEQLKFDFIATFSVLPKKSDVIMVEDFLDITDWSEANKEYFDKYGFVVDQDSAVWRKAENGEVYSNICLAARRYKEEVPA